MTGLKGLSPRHVWIFITERCSLGCDYCFFRGRGPKAVLPWAFSERLFEALPAGRPYDIVFSGGEPLLEWPLLRRMIGMARKRHPRAELTLQTNGLLLDLQKIGFLKEHDVVVEPGIDGDGRVNKTHRLGMSFIQSRKLLSNIQLLLGAGVRMNPTMTVHPDEANRLEENFSFLVGQGLSMIDVHPAFLSPWTKGKAGLFLKGYRAILVAEQRARRHLICKSYSSLIGPSVDLVVLPDGRIVPNWTFLTFPALVRDVFVMMRLTSGGLEMDAARFLDYVKCIKKFFAQGGKTYRDFSNVNARLALGLDGRARVRKWFSVYETLCQDIQRLDQRFLRRGDRLGI